MNRVKKKKFTLAKHQKSFSGTMKSFSLKFVCENEKYMKENWEVWTNYFCIIFVFLHFIAPPLTWIEWLFWKNNIKALKWNPIQFTPSWRPSEINNSHTNRSFSGNRRKLWIEIAWEKSIMKKNVDVGVVLRYFRTMIVSKKIKRARIGEFTRMISTSVVLEEWCFTILCQK